MTRNNDNFSAIYGVSKETGELIQIDMFEAIQEQELKIKKAIEYKKSQEEVHMLLSKNYGGFYFMFYKRVEKLKIEPQYLIRGILLSTHMDYDNYIVYGNGKGISNRCGNKDLQEILGLGKTEYIATKKDLIEKEILILNEDKTFSINSMYFKKGTINKQRGKVVVVRMFEEAIQEIYNKTRANEHKYISKFFEMLPYINYQSNTLCKNPKEEDFHKSEPLSLKEAQELFGYKSKKGMISSLFKIKVGGEPVIMVAMSNGVDVLVVNPRVYYKGKDIDSLSAIIRIFDYAGEKGK